MKSPSEMGGEELRRALKKADRQLGSIIDRMQIENPEFKEVLNLSLDLQAEADRRKK